MEKWLKKELESSGGEWNESDKSAGKGRREEIREEKRAVEEGG